MAVYKVPQDVEADDKLIGPFSFKQFIFILIAIAMGWLAFMSMRISPFLVILPLPFCLGFLVLGLPLRKDQPTDVYVAALINFWLRPKVRLWGQEGMTEHVVITAPKKEPHQYSDGLTRSQVKSKLSALAKTMDTRGWSSKNVDFYGNSLLDQSDRLVAATIDVEPNVLVDDGEVEDMLDAENSKLAQTFARLEAKSGTATIEQQASLEEPTSNIQMPGTQFVPGQSKPSIPQPRTIAEIAAIADAKNPVAHQPIAPIYTGNAQMPAVVPAQVSPADVVHPSAPTPSPAPTPPPATTIRNEPVLTAADINFDPFPTMNQKVIKPISHDDDTASIPSTTDMTEEPKTDILGGDNKSFEEGGEISLH